MVFRRLVKLELKEEPQNAAFCGLYLVDGDRGVAGVESDAFGVAALVDIRSLPARATAM